MNCDCNLNREEEVRSRLIILTVGSERVQIRDTEDVEMIVVEDVNELFVMSMIVFG